MASTADNPPESVERIDNELVKRTFAVAQKLGDISGAA